MIFIDKQESVTETFVSWLTRELKLEILANVDINRLNVLYEHSSDVLTKEINILSAFLSIVDSIDYHEFPDRYTIDVSQTGNFDGVPIKKIYNYITFGTLNIKGYPIISDTLHSASVNLKRYKLKYNTVGVM